MNLPDGVSYNARQPELISDGPSGILQIDRRRSATKGYGIRNRDFISAVAPFLRGDLEHFAQRFGIHAPLLPDNEIGPADIVYSGADHSGNPRLPNLMIVPNVPAAVKSGFKGRYWLLGCTMGKKHPLDPRGARIQEIYEFQSFGLLVIDAFDGSPRIWVARDGDKVAVPDDCHMTLYNLGDQDYPLVTLVFADSAKNRFDDFLSKQCGPILVAYYNDAEAVFRLNETYANADHSAGVKLARDLREMKDREIHIPRTGRMGLGELLYERLCTDARVIGEFAQLGFRIQAASKEGFVKQQGKAPIYFSRPLKNACAPGTAVHKYFLQQPRDPSPVTFEKKRFLLESEQNYEKKQSAVRYAGLDNPGVDRNHVAAGSNQVDKYLVVEGFGDWVTKAYRPALRKLAKKYKFTVCYANDSGWANPPQFEDDPLEEWEKYFDKADVKDSYAYNVLNPEAVFIVTPDFTHCDLAGKWVQKWASLIFIEKPFDSQVANVDRLWDKLMDQAAANEPRTCIYGLDHYQVRTRVIYDEREKIADHLNGEIREIRFYMTESNPLEPSRVRTLQYGLTLDMLPHFLAMLCWFGRIDSIDDIIVEAAGQYTGSNPAQNDVLRQFPKESETYSKVSFSFEPFAGKGGRVPCYAVVGKGFKKTAKFMEVKGKNGCVIRIDLKRPDAKSDPGYPHSHLMYCRPKKSSRVRTIQDAYDPKRELFIIRSSPIADQRLFYMDLIEDVLKRTSRVLGSTLLPYEARRLVEILDCIWRAVRETHGTTRWKDYPFQSVDPLSL